MSSVYQQTRNAFQSAVAFTLQHEGKTSLDPSDPGNWTGGRVNAGELRGTKYGISAAAYPTLDIQGLSIEGAKQIYYHRYWLRAKCASISQISEPLARRLFDLSVNSGVGGAGMMLQRALNTVCTGEIEPKRRAAWRQKIVQLLRGKVLRVDGDIGPVTLEVLAACPYPQAVLTALVGEAYCHYRDLNPLYIPGWLERLGAAI